MIKWKAKSQKTDRITIGLGLEPGNVQRLMDGEPVAVNGAALGLPVDIVIHYGKDAGAMIADLKQAGIEIGPGTTVYEESGEPSGQG